MTEIHTQLWCRQQGFFCFSVVCFLFFEVAGLSVFLLFFVVGVVCFVLWAAVPVALLCIPVFLSPPGISHAWVCGFNIFWPFKKKTLRSQI
jgi:hypothetical protein